MWITSRSTLLLTRETVECLPRGRSAARWRRNRRRRDAAMSPERPVHGEIAAGRGSGAMRRLRPLRSRGMHRGLQGMLFAAGLSAAFAAPAVMLGQRDQGQALIFPYYSVNAGNTTLLTLSNNGDRGKVVQLRVAEGEIGETALVTNLYLAGRD